MLSEVIQAVSDFKGDDPKQLTDLLGKMFAYDPEKRATPSEILKHPFLLQEKVLASDKTPKEQREPYEEEVFSYW